MNDARLRALIVGFGGGGVFLARRGSMQTLLGICRCVESAGFAPRTCGPNPGSPRQGSADPGLYYAAPSGLVYGGVEWRKMT